MKFDFIFFNPCCNRIRLDKYLSSQISDLSRGKIQFLIKSGRVTINNVVVTDCNYKLSNMTSIVVDYDKSDFAQISIEPDNISLNIIYEDSDIIVVNKPAGMVVHPSCGSYNKTLVNALMYYTKGNLASGLDDNSILNFRPGIVHRIDKETSGIIVVAKTTPALIKLQKQFEKHSIHRVYYAICFGKPNPPSNTIETMIAYNPKRQRQIVNRIYAGKKIRKAITNYETVKVFNIKNKYISLIRCKLETGRTHQIRVHMEYIGNPIIGDKLYGNNQKHIKNYDSKMQNNLNNITRHLLHATELGFYHPITGEKLMFKSDLPEDMQNLINFCQINYVMD